jgi:FkbM family methyltransferase
MLKNVKTLTKLLFRLCGLDIRRFKLAENNNYGWLVKHNIGTVLDIGANTGQFALMIHKILPYATIFSFEPIEECYNKLAENMTKVPKFHAFNYALGDTENDLEIYINEFTESSSFLPMADLHKRAFPYTAEAHLKKVKIKQLDVVARDLSFEGNLLIKIDVQGYEDSVIRGGHSVISQARVLIVETSFHCLYVGQPMFENIYDILLKMGFRYIGALDQLRSPFDGSVLQEDSIFIKEKPNSSNADIPKRAV